MIYRTRGKHADHYNTDAVLLVATRKFVINNCNYYGGSHG